MAEYLQYCCASSTRRLPKRYRLARFADLEHYVTSAQETLCSTKSHFKVEGEKEMYCVYSRHHRYGFRDFTYNVPISVTGN